MRTRIISSIAIASLALTACGGGGASGDRGELVDQFMEAAEDEDFDIDRDCLEKVANDLSDEDVKALLDAGPNGDPELSEAGQEKRDDVLECVDIGDMLNTVIDDLVSEMGEENVDRECLDEALGDLDLSNPEDPALVTAMIDCVNLGG